MTIDCFPFFNELDLLEVRLNELNDIVDYFVIVEANKTQSLKDKPFNFELNKNRYEKFLEKIVYVQLTECPNNDGNLWTMEHFQRNSISIGLEKLNVDPNDIIMISDMDEIPRSKSVKYVIDNNILDQVPVCTLDIDHFVYFMNLKASNKIWNGTILFRANLLSKYNIQALKDGKSIHPKIPNAGWHFSWLGGYKKIIEKAYSCIEPFDKSTIPSEETFKEYFNEYIKNPDKKFIHIENLGISGQIDLGLINNIDNHPEYIKQNMEKYQQYFMNT